MKTNLLLIIALLLVFFNVSAQNDTHFGLKGAMNLAGLSGVELDDGYEKSIRMAFGGGLFLNKELTPKTSIQIEAMYSAQGVELESDENPDELYRLDYLSVPILYRYHFEEKGSLSVQFGVQPAMLLNSQVKVQGGDEEGVFDFDEYYEGTDAEVNGFDVGLTAGFGFGFGRFSSITLTYTYGLMEVFKGNDAPQGAKTSLVQFSLAIPLTSNTY
tara:strand:+ start:6639 stop:7283 length:645 start_codon:yes stop_codon:yes gene_type:complete